MRNGYYCLRGAVWKGRLSEQRVERFEALAGKRLRYSVHQNEKFIAAPTKEHVVCARNSAHSAGNRANSGVADRMTITVIDRFQLIEINDCHTAGTAFFLIRKNGIEGVPGQRSGQRIHSGNLLEPVARDPQLSVHGFDFAPNAFHQDHNRSKAEQYFEDKIEYRGVLEVSVG